MFQLKDYQNHRDNLLYFIAAYVMKKWILFGVKNYSNGLWIRPSRWMNQKKDWASGISTVMRDSKVTMPLIKQQLPHGDQYYNSMTSHSFYLINILYLCAALSALPTCILSLYEFWKLINYIHCWCLKFRRSSSPK